MGEGFGDKVQGGAKELGGNIQEGVGRATGDRDMQAEGTANQVEGAGQQAVGNVKDAADNIGDALKGVFRGDD
ncbi:MAG: CsbD family protein [Chloroflexota bacterium]|nr:CsbD family protein [Chloroflexota bacterium]